MLSIVNFYFCFVFVFIARGCRAKTVQMTEMEVRGLCLKSREIFLSQPILLELEAPLKICGMFGIHHLKLWRVQWLYPQMVVS